MKVALFGAGYAGLVSGAGLAKSGHRVAVFDTSGSRLDSLRRGEAPFHEPGLAELLTETLASGSLQAMTNAEEALEGSDVSLVAVGTPSGADGHIDLSFVLATAKTIGGWLPRDRRRHTIVVKSTVVPGSTEGPIRAALEESSGLRAGVDFGLGMNPEFLREGSAVEDFLRPDRIVLGAFDPIAASALRELYAPFDCPKFETTPVNAEAIKYASNCLLATLVSFSNEWAAVCEGLPGADAAAVMEGLHLDRRFSLESPGGRVAGIVSYLLPGPGFGGSCLPKDLSAARAAASRIGVPTPVLDAVARVNHDRPGRILDLLRRETGDLRDRTVAVLGLAFKPGTDDVRDSPAFPLLRLLASAGAHSRVWDPMAPAAQGDRRRALTAEETLAGADAAVVVTGWPEIAEWDWERLLPTMRGRVIVDTRGTLAGIAWPHGVRYVRIGTGPVPETVKVR